MAVKKEEFDFKADDFVLVNSDTVIKDKKLETKPTTFFRDALKRFRKNKSSVVGGIILLILILLAIFVPIISPYDIETVKTEEKFLAPKLFEAGTGFWDGTRSAKHVMYDSVNEVPAISDKYTIAALKQSLVKLDVEKEVTYIDTYNKYGFGGLVVAATDNKVAGRDIFFTSKPISFTDKGAYTIDIELDNEENFNEGKLGEYRVYLKISENEEDNIIIRDFSHDYSPISFDISSAMKEKKIKNAEATIVFDVKSSSSAIQYILIKSIKLSGGERAKNLDVLEEVSFDNATELIGITDTTSNSYWSCNGRKGIHNSEVRYCDYTIDTYMLVYGDADAVTYSATELSSWIDKGWCMYNYKEGPESFVKLSNECPIDVVDSQTVLSVTKKLSSITGRGWGYHRLGYESMPKYIMGTDASGIDMFKRAFAGLRTSLVLGVLVAAFCFCFGLVWGSISGYFGGNVDLFMERFTDILGGVPWIVVMTLCILHLGNNFFVFILALCMTGWISTSSRTRTQFYRFKGREYVLASRTLGASDARLIFKHILPNSLGTIVTASVLMIPGIIFSEASLAYLNLGLRGSTSFGVMMANNQQYLEVYPFLVIFPAVVMALIMITFNLFGNGLRDALNPTLKGSD
ncbi:MAG: ABC transporter permease [Lachnospiraceae bacterium]|nr:ABC transporter permease [Lachnospiraceae bacterium]